MPKFKLSCGKRSKFSPLCLLFYSIPNGVDDAYVYLGGLPALPTPPTQMLISPRNSFTDTLRNNIKPNMWASHDPVKLVCKIKGAW
jgi:hypothetical protein